jgi:hypothetical protein
MRSGLKRRAIKNGKSSFGQNPPKNPQTAWQNSQLFELARLVVRLDYVARFIVNANHRIM